MSFQQGRIAGQTESRSTHSELFFGVNTSESKRPETFRGQSLSDLIAKAQAGDESALGLLLEAFRDQLRIQSQQDLRDGIGARIDASDIVQKTCISAVIHFVDFRGESPQEFAGWLRQIHRRNLVDEVRKHTATEKRDAAREVAGNPDESPSRLASPNPSPSHVVIRDDESRVLEEAITRLPEMQATVVRMKHLEGLRLREIAARTGKSEEAVAGLLRRGLRKLRSELDSPEQ